MNKRSVQPDALRKQLARIESRTTTIPPSMVVVGEGDPTDSAADGVIWVDSVGAKVWFSAAGLWTLLANSGTVIVKP